MPTGQRNADFDTYPECCDLNQGNVHGLLSDVKPQHNTHQLAMRIHTFLGRTGVEIKVPRDVWWIRLKGRSFLKLNSLNCVLTNDFMQMYFKPLDAGIL